MRYAYPALLSAMLLTVTGSLVFAAAPVTGGTLPSAGKRIGLIRRPALRSRAQGCAANGSPSFIGIASTKTPDYAGSGAGVAAGYSNSSCDFTDFIGAGI